MNRDEAETRALLKEHGSFVRNANHGELWRLPGGRTVMIFNSHGNGSFDWRAWKNARAEVRRALEQAGIELTSKQPPEGEQEEPVNHPVNVEDRLAELGAHVERRARILEERTTTVVVPLASIPLALGLEVPEGASIKLQGSSGERVHGPVTIKIVETEEKEVEL